MAYTIEYMLADVRIAGSAPVTGKDVLALARDGMRRHKADTAHIFNCGGLEVEVVRRVRALTKPPQPKPIEPTTEPTAFGERWRRL